MRTLFFCLLCLPAFSFAQDYILKEGVPEDLDQYKIIFFKHEKVKVSADKEDGAQGKYLHLRQTNHNKVIEEANDELNVAAMKYPLGYAISTKSAYEPLVKAGYKYALTSSAYNYENINQQPEEGVLVIYEYFIQDLTSNVAYKVFELDEMQIYHSKLLIKKLNNAVKKKYPEAY